MTTPESSQIGALSEDQLTSLHALRDASPLAVDRALETRGLERGALLKVSPNGTLYVEPRGLSAYELHQLRGVGNVVVGQMSSEERAVYAKALDFCRQVFPGETIEVPVVSSKY